jgi:hypothetical protein
MHERRVSSNSTETACHDSLFSQHARHVLDNWEWSKGASKTSPRSQGFHWFWIICLDPFAPTHKRSLFPDDPVRQATQKRISEHENAVALEKVWRLRALVWGTLDSLAQLQGCDPTFMSGDSETYTWNLLDRSDFG